MTFEFIDFIPTGYGRETTERIANMLESGTDPELQEGEENYDE